MTRLAKAAVRQIPISPPFNWTYTTTLKYYRWVPIVIIIPISIKAAIKFFLSLGKIFLYVYLQYILSFVYFPPIDSKSSIFPSYFGHTLVRFILSNNFLPPTTNKYRNPRMTYMLPNSISGFWMAFLASSTNFFDLSLVVTHSSRICTLSINLFNSSCSCLVSLVASYTSSFSVKCSLGLLDCVFLKSLQLAVLFLFGYFRTLSWIIWTFLHFPVHLGQEVETFFCIWSLLLWVYPC